MKRPSLQFYPADWRNNAKLRRASFHDRGVWLDVMCLMHDNDDYGLLRWPLEEIANAVGCRVKDLQSLVAKDILKGGDDTCAAYVHTPRHAGKDGETVTLIPEQTGPLWYSARMVRDEWCRNRRGGETRFTADSQPTRSPTARMGETPTGTPDQRLGDGASTSSSSSTSKESKASVGKPPPDSSPIVITLPLREGGEFPVHQSLIAEVEPLCPAVDVPATLKEMKLWLVGNPDRRKTRKGAKRFITTWLRNEQEKLTNGR